MATADPMVGRLLEGRYRIVERIARGGMSTVYSAVDQRLERRVAVKVMASALSADPKFSDRFAREARAAARLAHVNAVAVFDQGVDTTHGGHDVFLVMELVDGRTLRDLIREREGRFSPAEAVSIMEPVLSALSAAHRAGLVHRDVKPENILLSDDGLVKVADFGLARATDGDVASTRTGLMMGTVAYCAPEQITHGQSDQRSDVYSAGIVLFELLTGRPPYQGSSPMNVAFQHVHSRVPAPSSQVGGVPTAIDEIVVAATDSDPTGRPSDASAFLAELADARADLALPVVPIPPRRRPPVTRRPAAQQPPPVMPQRRQGPPAPQRPQRPTTPVRGVAPRGSTEVMGVAGPHDTQVVRRPDARPAPNGRPSTRAGGPPPPIVIPPPRRRSPRARRRRRALIAFIVIIILGAVSVAAGITVAHLVREWNTHVPKVGGLSQNAATQQLKTSGYAVDPAVASAFSETVPKGSVVGTDPAYDSRLAQGKTVRIVISLGKDRIDVPDVSSKPLATAQSTLQDRGLKFDPNATKQASKTVPAGSVISTMPTAGTPVKRSQVIKLVESTGLPYVSIPDVDPKTTTFDAENAALSDAQFKVARADDVFSDDVPPGNVINISPTGRARFGATITVTVSKGPELVTVPDFASLSTTIDDYSQALSKVGLVPDITNYFGGTHGIVLHVSPLPGAQLPPGSHVAVTVF